MNTLDRGPLTTHSFIILLDHLKVCDSVCNFLFFFALAALSWGWRVRIAYLRVDVDLVEVRDSTSKVNLGGAKFVLIGFNGLKLSLLKALLEGLALACRYTEV